MIVLCYVFASMCLWRSFVWSRLRCHILLTVNCDWNMPSVDLSSVCLYVFNFSLHYNDWCPKKPSFGSLRQSQTNPDKIWQTCNDQGATTFRKCWVPSAKWGQTTGLRRVLRSRIFCPQYQTIGNIHNATSWRAEVDQRRHSTQGCTYLLGVCELMFS